MPLERIENHRQPPTDRRRTSRSLLAIATFGVVAAILVSCSQGSSRDAERGREQDAERTSVVDNLQATETSRLVSGTPDASPTVEPEE
ncbi:MAG: hypothetical protein WKF63_06685 [Thermomicrobiales bacterium]